MYMLCNGFQSIEFEVWILRWGPTYLESLSWSMNHVWMMNL